MQQTFYIFRHAQAVLPGEHYGDRVVTATILPDATPPITTMGEYLKSINTDYNASSEYIRCRQTAEIITEITKKKFIFDSRLNEYIPGDDFVQTKSRIIDFVKEIKEKKYKNILICTHGAIIAALKHQIIYKKINEVDLTDFPEPGILWIIKGKFVHEIDFNS